MVASKVSGCSQWKDSMKLQLYPLLPLVFLMTSKESLATDLIVNF